jgi:hypothetical protein
LHVNVRKTARVARLRRTACALLLAVSWAGQIAAGALDGEYGRVHVRCAEHGEITHVAAVMAGRAAPQPVASLIKSASKAAFGHDHCPLSALLDRFTPSVKAGRPLAGTAAGGSGQGMVAQDLVPAQRSLLAAAPKTSPPSGV